MSISHEALQETQINSDSTERAILSQDEMTRDDWIDVSIALTIAVLLAAIMIAHYPQFNVKTKHVTIVKPSAIPAAVVPEATVGHVKPDEFEVSYIPEPPPKTIIQPKAAINSDNPAVAFDETDYKAKHVLNGVFVSDDEKVAMINNRFFNIGDIVDGMKIVDIQVDKIKLENANNKMELRIVV